MADPVSLTSGVITLVSFGLQTSKTLYRSIESLKNHTKLVRDLKNEVRGFQDVLEELEAVISDNVVTKFRSIRLPLFSCAAACQEFDALIQECTPNTTDSHRSMRDWTRLQVKAGDINDFRSTLSAYKSTLQVALGGINLQTSSTTIECLQRYQDMIRDTKADLQEHLKRLEDKLSSLPVHTSLAPRTAELSSVQRERDSTIACLEISQEVSTHIDERKTTTFQNLSTPSDGACISVSTEITPEISSSQVVDSALDQCQKTLTSAKSEPQGRLQVMQDSLLSMVGHSKTSKIPEDAKVRECLALCDVALQEASKARINLYEDVSTGEDSHQVIVSTIGDLISAKRVTAGPRSTQMLGHMSDESLQHAVKRFSPEPRVSGSSRPTGNVNLPNNFHGVGRQL